MTYRSQIEDIERLLRRCARDFDTPFWLGLDGRTHTHGSLWENAVRIGQELRRLHGLSAGDVVVPSFRNDVCHAVLLYAALREGWMLCPMVPGLPQAVQDDLLALVRPSLVISAPLEVDVVSTPGRYNPADSVDLARPFLLATTSGSTGRPKAICHTGATLLGSALAFGRLSEFSKMTRLYHVLPMVYMAGIVNTLLAPALAGATVVEGPLFSAEGAPSFWARPFSLGVNTLSVVPLIAATLVATTRDLATRTRVAKEMPYVQSTSAPIPAGLRRRFVEHFGVPLRDCYGITEVGGPLSLQSEQDASALTEGSVVAPPFEIEIRKRAGLDELWIRSPFFMKGYREGGNYQLMLDERGFFDTGDLATFEQGRLTIVGRKKEIIVRGGVNVSPRRLEMLFSSVQEFEEVAVLGIDRPMVGERVVAFVRTRLPPTEARQVLYSLAREQLAEYERPDEVILVAALPRLFNGKIDKQRLRSEHAAR